MADPDTVAVLEEAATAPDRLVLKPQAGSQHQNCVRLRHPLCFIRSSAVGAVVYEGTHVCPGVGARCSNVGPASQEGVKHRPHLLTFYRKSKVDLKTQPQLQARHRLCRLHSARAAATTCTATSCGSGWRTAGASPPTSSCSASSRPSTGPAPQPAFESRAAGRGGSAPKAALALII